MRRGEIWWVELPERQRRPYLVLSRDAAIEVLTAIVAAALTTTIRDLPTELVLDVEDGVPRRSAVSFDNVETLPKWAFVERVTRLEEARALQVCTALRTALDC